MLKRTLFFTTPAYLSVRNSQLRIQRRDIECEDRTIPIEDIAFILLENPAITLSVALIQRLQENKVCVIFCNATHHPEGILLPHSGNTIHGEILRLQIEASTPLPKRLWQQTVQAKISNQANLLKNRGIASAKLLYQLVPKVKTDDPDNREGVAARIYWQNLFGEKSFVRDREGSSPNSIFNYGYSILRAATARALVSSGLNCAIGIHHRNRYNPYGLADDIMEPYRPYVDQCVCEILKENHDIENLTPTIKLKLLEILSSDTHIDGGRKPLMLSLSTTTASLVKCLRGESSQILYPVLE
jgi:CRISP-associated protein Cas1